MYIHCIQGTDKKQTKKTTKQDFHQGYFVFLMNNFNTTNRKEVKFCFCLPIGPNKIVQQENNDIFGEILGSLSSVFLNPFPGNNNN